MLVITKVSFMHHLTLNVYAWYADLFQFDEKLCPKLADFGASRIKSSLTKETPIKECPAVQGTEVYLAPEVQIKNHSVQPHSDVWSTCVTMISWMTGKSAWKDEGFYGYKASKTEPHRLKLVQPKELKNILAHGLSYEPASRPTAKDIRDRVNELSDKGEGQNRIVLTKIKYSYSPSAKHMDM